MLAEHETLERLGGNKPKAADIFTAQYLPPREQRLVK